MTTVLAVSYGTPPLTLFRLTPSWPYASGPAAFSVWQAAQKYPLKIVLPLAMFPGPGFAGGELPLTAHARVQPGLTRISRAGRA